LFLQFAIRHSPLAAVQQFATRRLIINSLLVKPLHPTVTKSSANSDLRPLSPRSSDSSGAAPALHGRGEGGSVVRPLATASVAIIGLGYVGLPLSLQFARSGVSVLGLDIDDAKVEALTQGRTYIKHIPADDIHELVTQKKFRASTDFSMIRDVDAVIICVPTPLNKNREPDISYILETGKAIAPFLASASSSGLAPDLSPLSSDPLAPHSPSDSADSPFAIRYSQFAKKLVVLESTTYPGTTDEDLRAVLEAGSGLIAGKDFHLAFSPEREDPGNPNSKVAIIPKVVGGLTPACLKRALDLYRHAIKTLVPVSSCRAAEATKILENTFRSVNIALVNELKMVYSAMDIDIWEVISAAKTKPFGFMPFYPGPGLGGHCIPIDPFYLTWKAREYGQNTRFIELAGEINSSMPEYVIQRVSTALNARRRAVNGSRLLILGLAYKPNVDDDRESPSYILMESLEKLGAAVDYYDPHVPIIRPTREHPQRAGTCSVKWSRQVIGAYDAVLIATHHAAVNYRELADWSDCIIDSRNVMAAIKTVPGQVWKA
jgi:UDP-N-acetyl-D-glucosamine dehydrogenase